MNSAIENLGMSADELREKIHTLMPKWLEDELDEFRYLSGGYSNVHIAFKRNYAASDRNNTLGTYYVLRLPRRPQPYVNRQAEAAWYERMPEPVGLAPLVLDVPSGQMITPWLSGDLLVDVFITDLLMGIEVQIRCRHASCQQVFEDFGLLEIANDGCFGFE